MVGNYRSQGLDEANGQLKAKVLESGQIFLFSHGQDPELTFSETIYLRSAQLTMRVFLTAVIIRVRIFLTSLTSKNSIYPFYISRLGFCWQDGVSQ